MTDEPQDLGAMQYSARICEENLAWPANSSNLQLVSASIGAIAKRFRRTPYKAFKFLEGKIKAAQTSGIEVNGFWFREGKYMDSMEPTGERTLKPHKPCGNCIEGWVKVGGFVKLCECKRAWIAAAKAGR